MLTSVAANIGSAEVSQARKSSRTPPPGDESGCSLAAFTGTATAPITLLSSLLGSTPITCMDPMMNRKSLQHNAKLAKNAHRKNRVLEAFPGEIFGSGTLRKEFFLPQRIADAARSVLDTRPPPYIKMVNPLNIHALAFRHSRIMQMRAASGEDSQDSSTLAGRILEAGDRLLDVLRKYNGLCVERYKLSLGIAMIDYVKEGCHSRDTSFFLLYMLSGDSPSSFNPEDDPTQRASAVTPETSSDGSDKPRVKQEDKSTDDAVSQKAPGETPSTPTRVKSEAKDDMKNRWMKGTEPGKWFVFAVVDIVEMPKSDSFDGDSEPRITVDTDNLERIATEYGRYLLKKDVPPRSESDIAVRPRRGRKPKRLSPRNSTESGGGVGNKKASSDSSFSEDSSDYDSGTSPSKTKAGEKRNSKSPGGPDAKRPSVLRTDGLSSLESSSRLLASLHSPKVFSATTTTQPVPAPPQQSPVYTVTQMNPVQNPPVFSMAPVNNPPASSSSFIGTAGRTNGISFFRLTPSEVTTIATMSPSIIATNPRSPSPSRTLFCLSPNVSPLIGSANQSMYRSPFFFSSPSLTTNSVPIDPVAMNSSLVLDVPAQMPPSSAPSQFNGPADNGNNGNNGNN